MIATGVVFKKLLRCDLNTTPVVLQSTCASGLCGGHGRLAAFSRSDSLD